MSLSFNNKNILITGAAYGIGEALAYLLAQDGANLLLIDREKDKLENVVRTITAKYQKTPLVMVKDLTQSQTRESIFSEMADQRFSLDILINNVSVGYWRPFSETPLDKIDQMIETNIKCLTHLTKLALPSLIQKEQALIINLSSTASFIGSPNGTCYSGTKAYIRLFGESLNMELRGTGVKVVTIFPGATTTRFWEYAQMKDSAYFKNVPKMTAEEVAREALTAIKKGRISVITGFLNKFNMLMVKLLPRSWIIKAAVRRFKD